MATRQTTTKRRKKPSVLKNYKFNRPLSGTTFENAFRNISRTIEGLQNVAKLKDVFRLKRGQVNLPYNRRRFLIDLLKRESDFNGRFINLTLGDTTYRITNNKTKSNLLNSLEDDFAEEKAQYSSDEQVVISWRTADTIEIELGAFENGVKSGGYFNKSLLPHHKRDLEPVARLLQVNIQDVNYAVNLNVIKKDNCFINSVKTYTKSYNKQNPKQPIKVSPEFYNLYQDFQFVELKQLGFICDDYNIRITLTDCDCDDKRPQHYSYGKSKDTAPIKIALINSHFIPVIPSGVTRFYMRHRDQLKDEPNAVGIVRMGKKGKYERDKTRGTMNTLDLLRFMLVHKDEFFIDNIDILNTDNFIREDAFICDQMELSESKCNPRVYKRPKERHEYVNVYGDTETNTSTEPNVVLKPFMCAFYTKEEHKLIRYSGKDCCLRMLDYLQATFPKQRIKLLFHNLKFDLSMILGDNSDDFTSVSLIERNGTTICGDFTYKKSKFYTQDSMGYLNMPLSAFSKAFSLPQEKGVLPYKYYTEENIIKNERITLEKFKEYVVNEHRDKDYTKINQAVDKARALMDRDGLIDMIEYCGVYCDEDVILLEKGLTAFSNIIKENIFNIDVDKLLDEYRSTFIDPDENEAVELIENRRLDLQDFKDGDLLRDYKTISSLSDAVTTIKGSYDGVVNLTGIARKFIQRALYGGRVQSRFNRKYYITELLNDLDAVSLYPSAMFRMDGFLVGRPKLLQSSQLNKQFLDLQDGYFVEIKIIKVGRKRAFSVVGLKLEDRRLYDDNELEGCYIVVDKTTLEMLVKYNEIEYEITQGYYFNEGRNGKICEVIKELFDLRLQAKANKNKSLSDTYKLILNSLYGKTGLKAEDYKTRYLKQADFDRLMKKKGMFIYKSQVLNNGFIKYTQINNVEQHYNAIHVTCEVLSMSKKIMNEVVYLAEDAVNIHGKRDEIKIYYTDTDSLHITDKDIRRLSKLFQDKYGRVLIGEGLGQFHTDFSSEKLKGDLVATETVILGAKCYVDTLTTRENLDADNKIIDEDLIDHHIRMKGCNTASIKGNNEGDVMKTFKQMLENKPMTMDLTDEKDLFSCKTGDFKVETNAIVRTIGFDTPSYTLVGNKTLTVITPLNNEEKYNLKQQRIKNNLQAIRRQ